MFPAVKEGISANISEKPNNWGSWSLVLACQMITYLLTVPDATSRVLQIKGLFKNYSYSFKTQIIISKYKYRLLQGGKKKPQLQVFGLWKFFQAQIRKYITLWNWE